jgi:hypothetical protein
MTDEEKTIVKQMNRAILELTYQKALHEAVLKSKVADWKKEIGAADSSPTLQGFRKRIDEAREAADFLIDSGKLAAARDKGLVN